MVFGATGLTVPSWRSRVKKKKREREGPGTEFQFLPVFGVRKREFGGGEQNRAAVGDLEEEKKEEEVVSQKTKEVKSLGRNGSYAQHCL